MAVRMTHPVYGERTVRDEIVEHKTRLGWKVDGEVVPEVVEGSVQDVVARVGDDPEKAREALVAEQARSKPRKSLVTAVAPVAESDTKEK